ncbi:hypothetical protein HJC99_00935 [Candidatus Saccharibacteria bacterium]|nr:hypothetical protein [Candidatus Saccharibacteria bacterium]
MVYPYQSNPDSPDSPDSPEQIIAALAREAAASKRFRQPPRPSETDDPYLHHTRNNLLAEIALIVILVVAILGGATFLGLSPF